MKRLYTLALCAFVSIASYAQASNSITDASQVFAFNLFNKVVADRENFENVNVSPLSAQLALSMLINGANGETKDEIMKAMSFEGVSLDEVNTFSNKLLDEVTKRPEFKYDPNLWPDEEMAMNAFNTEYPLCELANGIWMRNNFIFQNQFVKTMRELYYAGIDNCDFTTQEGVKKVNDWVSDHTHGLIEKVFNGPQSEELAILLANALYFKGVWTVEFRDELTQEAPFYLPEGKAVNVMMMNNSAYYKSFTTEKFKTVTLTYGYNNKFSMTIFLPINEKAMPELSLADWKITFANGKDYYKPLNLYMPRFEFDDSNNLVPTLQSLGMQKAFGSQADLSNMVDNAELFVGKVFQLSKIKVNEKGTEAAAVTVIEIAGSSFDEPEYEDFIINRPFYFTIEDRQSQSLLFIGRVSDFTGDKFEVATPISNIEMPKSNNSCYDLSGRLLKAEPEQGIYIKDGRKVISH